MAQPRLFGLILFQALAICTCGQACMAQLTPERKQQVENLKQDLAAIRDDIEQARQDDARYSGGLIKALIGIRLQVLKTNEALVEQRIHALESGARTKIVVNITKPDAARASELARDIEAQKAKVAEARTEAAQYSGGLVQAMALSTLATARNSLAMLEQQYFIAKYGLAMPAPPSAATFSGQTAEVDEGKPVSRGVSAPSPPETASDCLKIGTFDSSVLSANEVFTEVAWKADVTNSCSKPFQVRVRFTIYDKDEFELDSDDEDIYVPASGTGKARGKMLVSPPEKAARMAKQGAAISAR